MTYREDCFFFKDYQDMQCRVPTCLLCEYGKCPCSFDCQDYISKDEAFNIIKTIVRNKGKTIEFHGYGSL